MKTGYNAVVEYSSKELSKKERYMICDTTNATPLDTASADSDLIIDFDYYALIAIHNERAKDNKDYKKCVIVDKAGNKFTTGSQSFIETLQNICEVMEGEDFQIQVFQKASKNYSGKNFITCSLI